METNKMNLTEYVDYINILFEKEKEKTKFSKIKSLFYTSKGLPKKEILLRVPDVAHKLKIKTLPFNYMNGEIEQKISAALGQIFKQAIEHHINFLRSDTPGEKYVYYGFSHREEIIDNNEMRVIERGERIKEMTKKVKRLSNIQRREIGNKSIEIVK